MATLLTKGHDSGHYTYILVRGSESFSNTIRDLDGRAPTIKFDKSGHGAIKFHNGQSYDFSLEQLDNSVECIRQNVKNNSFQSIGRICSSLHINNRNHQAVVFKRTINKMEAAEIEKRKYCTKLLGDNNTSTTPSTTTTTATNKSSISLLSSSSTSSSSSSSLSSSSITRMNGNSTGSIATTTATSNTTTTTNNNNKNNKNASNVTNNNNSNNINNSNNNNNYANISKYPTITNDKQLKKYKADFDKDFEEYQHLHGYLQTIEEKFRKLRELLNQSVEGSPDWEFAKEKIFNEYERVKGDSNFHKARSKYKLLRNKLIHIKEKIFQYKRQKRVRLHSQNNNISNNTVINNNNVNVNNNNKRLKR